eukprot:GHVT01062426.1.p1 GENE.GHVT01062426.1~~GHVT01062426.1.p1  ORF type:complete len:564 (-),score=125.72 GHVT01062426.1:236-1927(-)
MADPPVVQGGPGAPHHLSASGNAPREHHRGVSSVEGWAPAPVHPTSEAPTAPPAVLPWVSSAVAAFTLSLASIQATPQSIEGLRDSFLSILFRALGPPIRFGGQVPPQPRPCATAMFPASSLVSVDGALALLLSAVQGACEAARGLPYSMVTRISYLLNDLLQHAAFDKHPAEALGVVWPRLAVAAVRGPLPLLCELIAHHPMGSQQERLKCVRVLRIWKDRNLFSDLHLHDLLVSKAQGNQADAFPDPSLALLEARRNELYEAVQSTASDNQCAHAHPGADGNPRGSHQKDGAAIGSAAGEGGELPRCVDTFLVQFPVRDDLAAVEAEAQPLDEEEKQFRTFIKEALPKAQLLQADVAEKHARRRLENSRLCSLREECSQRLASEMNPLRSVAMASLHRQMFSARGKIQLLIKKEYNQRVELQELYLALARRVEERLHVALTRHQLSREAKAAIDATLRKRGVVPTAAAAAAAAAERQAPGHLQEDASANTASQASQNSSCLPSASSATFAPSTPVSPHLSSSGACPSSTAATAAAAAALSAQTPAENGRENTHPIQAATGR